MHPVGKIDREIYKCITEDIVTDEVILTDERIAHIKDHHPDDFEKYQLYLRSVIEEPDYIIEDRRSNTALILKYVYDADTNIYLRMALRLATSTDDPAYKNSILTFWKISKKKYEQFVSNKNILYKRK